MIRLELEGVPPSINQWSRGHWSVRAEHSVDWIARVLVAARGRIPAGWDPNQAARVTITFYCRRDPDNMAKFVVDGLVKNRVIADDKYPFLDELVLRQRPAKPAEYRTVVEVEPVGRATAGDAHAGADEAGRELGNTRRPA